VKNGFFDRNEQWGQYPMRTIQDIARAIHLIFKQLKTGAFTKSGMMAKTFNHSKRVPGGLKDKSHDIFAKFQIWSKAHFSSAHASTSSSIQ
jgi:hypothetical protein